MKIITIIPKLHDYLTSVIIEGLYKNNIEVISSEIGNNVRKVYSKKEIIEHSKDAEYILVFGGKIKGNNPPKYFLLDKMNNPEKTAFIDGSEWNFSSIPEKNQVIESLNNPERRRGKNWINKIMFNYCRWYFKRECYPQDVQKGIIPLLFAAEDKFFSSHNHEKKFDVFCSFGQKSTGLRLAVEKVCKSLKKEGYKIIIGSGFPYKKYLELISSSYISIDAWGGGDCNARIWEIIANKSCCFVQKYNVLFPNNFTDGYNYVEYSTIDEFEKKIRYYLKNKNECVQIAERGYEHMLKYHTSKERARYLLDILEKDQLQRSNSTNKGAVGKLTYLSVILNSFLKNPRFIYKYLLSLLKELLYRIKK